MATRKSTRLQAISSQTPVEVRQPAIDNVAGKKGKRKASVIETGSTQGSSRGKTKVAKPTLNKGKPPQIQAQSGSIKDKISSLPPEILKLTLDNIKDPSTINALSRTCKNLYGLMMPRLYDRLAVAAMFHANIPKLIRTLEPHLTIAQKKQLKKEGKYKGQQERYSTSLDEKAKPLCANYVRQMIVGASDPGKRHRYIVVRYIEEAFKNMENLEIVETWVYTKSIGESLASMKKLKALRFFLSKMVDEEMKPLANINNLKHLDVQGYSAYSDSPSEMRNVVHSMLRNSKSTLQSLVMNSGSYSGNFLQDWDPKTSGKDATTDGSYAFTALKSLSFYGVPIDADAMKSLDKAINFMRLRELTLAHPHDEECLLLKHLASLATSCQDTSKGISLRKISLEMSSAYRATTEQKRLDLKAKFRFISSFGTLTTLDLPGYGEYSVETVANSGLPDMLLQAILKHKNLKTLRLSYEGVATGFKVPYLSAGTVGAIISGLPHLQEFQFAPDEEQMYQIGQALARGTSLTSVSCFPYASWVNYPRPDNHGDNVINGILKGFLASADSSSTEKFVWEDHYKLRRVSLSWKIWDVASKFGKGEKRLLKPEKVTCDENENREVLFRNMTNSYRGIYIGYDPNEWVDKVDREIQ